MTWHINSPIDVKAQSKNLSHISIEKDCVPIMEYYDS